MLGPWLSAPDGPQADRALARLLAEEAAPVFESIMRRKFSAPHQSPDAEDIISETRLQIVGRLQRLRAASPCDKYQPLSNFRAYVATVTYTAWAGHLRRRHPAPRDALQPGALPPGRPHGRARVRALAGGGRRVAGRVLSAWQDEGRLAQPTPRERWLLVDATAAAAEAFGGADRVPTDLPALIARLLSWLGGPLELSELVRALAELLGVSPTPERSVEDIDEGELAEPHAAPCPAENLRWKEYLGWLWRETCALPLRQRTAFLLHGSVLREMELLGLGSVRAAAAALELAPERMAELWNLLPLDDLRIAALLGGSRQQVINLRKVARATLGQAWKKWQGETF